MNDPKESVSESFSQMIKATRSQKKGAKEVLRLGQKVYDYRKDLLSEEDASNLEKSNSELKRALNAKPVSGPELEAKAKRVDQELQKSGDLYYHKKTWVENVEMLLVAAMTYS